MLELKLTRSSRGLPEGLSIEEFRASLSAAGRKWKGACTPRITVEEPADLWSARPDDVNLVAFRGDAWCRNLSCASDTTYARDAVAMTLLHSQWDGSELPGGDVELNSHLFGFSGDTGSHQWESKGQSVTIETVPFEFVLVHEIGHLLGLPDRCEVGPSHSRTEWGNCEPGFEDSVMHAPSGRVTPSSRDLGQLCTLWPAAREQENSGEGVEMVGELSSPVCTAENAIWGALGAALVVGASRRAHATFWKRNGRER